MPVWMCAENLASTGIRSSGRPSRSEIMADTSHFEKWFKLDRALINSFACSLKLRCPCVWLCIMPLRRMGSGGIAYAFLTLTLCTNLCSLSRLSLFTPEERGPGTCWICERMVHTASLEVWTREKPLIRAGNRVPITPFSSWRPDLHTAD